MNNLVLPQQDFFLYVPALGDAEESLLWPRNREAGEWRASDVPETLDNWVQIPIDGKLTLYARVWEAE